MGETHEDVDAIFGVLHESLINKDVVTYDGLVDAIKYAFREYRLPVVVLPVDATLDYKEFYAPHMNKHLGGYGYSDVECGYHILRLSDEFEHGAAFRKWQSPTFVDVALSRDELPPDKRPPADARFMPTLMLVDSPWAPAKIMTSRPTGKPPVAQLREYQYSQVVRDMDHLMKSHDANVRARVKENWTAFVAQRPKEQADADANSCLPNWDRFVIRPADAATGGHRVNARSAAMQSAVATTAQNRITNDAQEQTALRNTNAANDTTKATCSASGCEHVCARMSKWASKRVGGTCACMCANTDTYAVDSELTKLTKTAVSNSLRVMSKSSQ